MLRSKSNVELHKSWGTLQYCEGTVYVLQIVQSVPVLIIDIFSVHNTYVLPRLRVRFGCLSWIKVWYLFDIRSTQYSVIIAMSFHIDPLTNGNLPHHGEITALQWRHNDHDSVSNDQPHGCLLNRLFRRRSKKTSMLRVTGLCVGNSSGPVNSPHKWPVTRKMFPFDDVIMRTDALTPYLEDGHPPSQPRYRKVSNIDFILVGSFTISQSSGTTPVKF